MPPAGPDAGCRAVSRPGGPRSVSRSQLGEDSAIGLVRPSSFIEHLGVERRLSEEGVEVTPIGRLEPTVAGQALEGIEPRAVGQCRGCGDRRRREHVGCSAFARRAVPETGHGCGPAGSYPTRPVGYARRPGVVGARGFEPPTSASRTLRATRLRHAPTGAGIVTATFGSANRDRWRAAGPDERETGRCAL